MPLSKRNDVVILSKTSKKSFLKERLVKEVRKCIDTYDNILLFDVKNMRNVIWKDVRSKVSGRFFFGKNKVVAVAMGRNKAEAYKQNLHKLSKLLVGQVGILFTNEPADKMISYFKHLKIMALAHAGDEAANTFVIPSGLSNVSETNAPFLRDCNLSFNCVGGSISLEDDFSVCQSGDILTEQQAKLLRLWKYPNLEFRIQCIAVWKKPDIFELLNS